MTPIDGTFDRSRNCGSYALKLKEWFRFRMRFSYTYNPQEYPPYLQAATKEILSRFPRLRQVDRAFVENNPYKNIIAFRMGSEDWHFIARRNRTWSGKMGMAGVYKYTKKEALDEVWYNFGGDVYDSEIIFFAYR